MQQLTAATGSLPDSILAGAAPGPGVCVLPAVTTSCRDQAPYANTNVTWVSVPDLIEQKLVYKVFALGIDRAILRDPAFLHADPGQI